ncbi:MAG: hypothetical protein M3Y91_17280 [Actinomycetota bacterium]|nr:hypothetical protein [Actinomycetota bacterium]
MSAHKHKNVLVVHAVGERTGGTWYCEAVDPHPAVKGLFAWGETFTEARKGLAAMVVAAVPPGSFDAVRIQASTHKTFALADLETG